MTPFNLSVYYCVWDLSLKFGSFSLLRMILSFSITSFGIHDVVIQYTTLLTSTVY